MQTSTIGLALAGLLVASTALAQAAPPPAGGPDPAAGLTAAPPPPPPPGPFAGAEQPPPPRGGPRGDRPPPPPPGAHVVLDRAANGFVHVDVHCAQQDTTRDCADIATRLLAVTGAEQPAR